MNSFVANNATEARDLYGTAKVEVPSFSVSCANEESSLHSIRGRVLWRAMYAASAPRNEVVPQRLHEPAQDAGSAKEGVLSVMPQTKNSSTFGSSTGPQMSSALTAPVAQRGGTDATPGAKRPRDADPSGEGADILSVNPELLKQQTSLVAAKAANEEVEMQNYKPPSRWKLSKVLVGHQGWVWTAAVEPGNRWFATGGFDAVIKVWDLATGQLKVNLTGHKEAVRSIAMSKQSPYMFSGSDDHSIKCWDLERNEVVREFFGHRSAVHCVAVHPTLDIVVSGGRDNAVRVFDIRQRSVVHTLTGHTDSVMSLITQSRDPQIISGGSDGFVYLWDLAAGKAQARLTRHKKPVRGLALTASGGGLVSCGADEIRVWKLPTGEYVGHASTTVVDDKKSKQASAAASTEEEISYRWSSCTMSPRNVLCVGSQSGEVAFYDWNRPQSRFSPAKFYAPFQFTKTKSLPGTLQGEGGINAVTYDVSGTRLITTESDKSVKIWCMKE